MLKIKLLLMGSMYLQEHKSEKELRRNQEMVVSGLSDREKIALAAEKRMATQVPRSSVVLRYFILLSLSVQFTLPTSFSFSITLLPELECAAYVRHLWQV